MLSLPFKLTVTTLTGKKYVMEVTEHTKIIRVKLEIWKQEPKLHSPFCISLIHSSRRLEDDMSTLHECGVYRQFPKMTMTLKRCGHEIIIQKKYEDLVSQFGCNLAAMQIYDEYHVWPKRVKIKTEWN